MHLISTVPVDELLDDHATEVRGVPEVGESRRGPNRAGAKSRRPSRMCARIAGGARHGRGAVGGRLAAAMAAPAGCRAGCVRPTPAKRAPARPKSIVQAE